jgi:hypothetical protein
MGCGEMGTGDMGCGDAVTLLDFFSTEGAM